MFAMKSIRHTLIASALLASLSGLALAQTVPEAKTDSPRAQRMEQMRTPMGERHSKHWADLKGKLGPLLRKACNRLVKGWRIQTVQRCKS
jgi:TolA-binding protein